MSAIFLRIQFVTWKTEYSMHSTFRARRRLLKQEKVKTPQRSVTRTVRNTANRTASTEIDVRGENVMDAVMDVDRAIDAAVLQGLHMITIIHGKGTGILRKEIQNHLRSHPSVRTFRIGVFGEGDSGVTIAELK